jgi:hypothetical protein
VFWQRIVALDLVFVFFLPFPAVGMTVESKLDIQYSHPMRKGHGLLTGDGELSSGTRGEKALGLHVSIIPQSIATNIV